MRHEITSLDCSLHGPSSCSFSLCARPRRKQISEQIRLIKKRDKGKSSRGNDADFTEDFFVHLLHLLSLAVDTPNLIAVL